MPRTRSLAWSELKIGIVSVFALVMAATVIFMLSGDTGFFWQQYGLKAVFDNIAGLKEGAPVRIAGVEQGSVTAISFVGNRVEVVMTLAKEMRSRITDRSIASLGSVSLLGEAAVDITASGEGQPIPEWGYVKVGRAAGSISDVAVQAGESLQATTKLLEQINSGRGTVGRLFTDDALFVELNKFVAAAEEVARNVNRGRGTLGRLAQDQTAAKALEASLQNLEAVTGKLRAGEGSLGQLLHNDALSKSLTSTTANLDTVTGRLSRGEGTAGKLMTDDALFNRLNSVSDRMDKLIAQLQNGEGTAGQLLHNKQLYENMNGAVTEFKNLLGEIKKDPKKYLNVKVSIF